jgi:serine/threonine protein kinase
LAPQVLHIALELAKGLEYLHPTIMHRDLKVRVWAAAEGPGCQGGTGCAHVPISGACIAEHHT